MIRKWLEGVTSDGDKRILTIEQTAAAFKSGLGDEVNIYYFGREATSMGPAGGNLRASIHWQGEQIVTEEKEAKGKGLKVVRVIHGFNRGSVLSAETQKVLLRLKQQGQVATYAVNPTNPGETIVQLA